MTPLRAHRAWEIADAWNAGAGPKYRIDAALVAQNLLQHSLFHEEASVWKEGAFVAVKRSAAALYHGPDPNVVHLSLLGKGTFLPQLLEHAVDVLTAEGYENLVVGQDSGHFLPGAPTDIPWPGLFAKSHGFEPGGLSFDLERDLGRFTEDEFEKHDHFRVLEEKDIEALNEFMKSQFPGRWHFDVMGKVEVEGPATVFGLFSDGECLGFSLLQSSGANKPIGGATWNLDLGERWGSLGPIGIAERLRGAGLGRAFLSRSLFELRSRGVRRAIIDWTGLVDFYGTQGFSVNRTYRSYRRSLRADPRPSA